MNNRTYVIVGGGDLTPSFLRERLEAYPDAFVVAADRGLDVLGAVGRLPDHVLGDFDSADAAAVDRFRESANAGSNAGGPAGDGSGTGDPSGTEACPGIETFPAEKDFTDTEAAISYALDRGAAAIVLLGMTGGRLDHFLANVHNLLIPLKAGVPAEIEDPLNRISLLKGGQTRLISKKEAFGRYLSLLPVTDEISGLTLKGVKYPLDRATVKKGVSLCISNEIADETAEIELGGGIAAVILSKDR